MRSKAHFKGHPIHAILIAFPIAFITGTILFDFAGSLLGWEQAWPTGAYLSIAAVVSGLAAGVPGLIDYLTIVPPKSSAKSRATWHMLINVTALALFAIGWAFRNWETYEPHPLALALEALGMALVSVGGFMGGTLVYRNQIGVDHRYAFAGKWKEETIEEAQGRPVVIPGAKELKPGQMMLLHVGKRRIVLARTDAGFAAFQDACTHRGASLADGTLSCDTVTCPWHGSQFDVRDGSVQAGPAEKALETYEIEQSNGQVRLIVARKLEPNAAVG